MARLRTKATQSSSILAIQRYFYGVLGVEEKKHEPSGRPSRVLFHGRVVHGLQFLDPAGREAAVLEAVFGPEAEHQRNHTLLWTDDRNNLVMC